MSIINVLLVNRNLLTTTKNTLEFLRKEDRVKVHILDQASTYPPLLEWYKTIPENVIYCGNEGPYSCWNPKYKDLRRNNFIVADSDCLYDEVPDDWLDVMLEALENSPINKVGFSLKIKDLPNTDIGKEAYFHEIKYWKKKVEYGWDAHVDTTFALYRGYAPFSYDAIRLDSPYTIKHAPWYLNVEDVPVEWLYYLEHASGVSTWGSKIKKALK
jgi:hypothetical protein